jgi:hypothetical protein
MEEQEFIDANEIKSLKVAYQKAVEENREEFTYKGHTLLTGYAKYLIEYLELNNKKQD